MGLKKGSQTNARDSILDTFFAKKNRRGAIMRLKTERTYQQAKALLPKLGFATPFGDLRAALLGTVKTGDWNETMKPAFLPRSEDLIEEIGWLAHGFIHEAITLNSFLAARIEFGRAYMLGDLERATNILKLIEHDHGVSLWLAERQFMLLQTREGFAGHKQRLSAIQASITQSLVGYLVTTISNRLEVHVTYEAFSRMTQQVLKGLRADGHPEFASWVELHISPWTFEWETDRHELVLRCTGKVLIDRYERVIKTLCSMSSGQLQGERKQQLSLIVSDLLTKIQDRQLAHLYATLTSTPKSIDAKTDRFFGALDQFVKGQYFEAIKEAETLLLDDPTTFEFYWLLARANACAQSPVEVNLPKPSFAHQIYDNLLQIAENSSDLNVPLQGLLTLALKLGDNHLGLSLWQFALYEQSHFRDPVVEQQARIQSKIDVFDPLWGHDSLQRECVESVVRSVYGHHVSVRLAGAANKPTEIVGEAVESVSPILIGITTAKRLSSDGKHQAALSTLESIVECGAATQRELNFHSGSLALLQFESLIALDRAEEAASAVLGHYIRNPNALRHIEFERLIQGGMTGKWPTLRRFVTWPIITYLNNGTEQDIYEAVDDLLREHRCSSPIAFCDGSIPCTQEELRILLRDVLVPDVIARGALWCRTAENRRNLRRQLL